jgi:hypothetical protein
MLKLVNDDGTELVSSEIERRWVEFVRRWAGLFDPDDLAFLGLDEKHAAAVTEALDDLGAVLLDSGVLRPELAGLREENMRFVECWWRQFIAELGDTVLPDDAAHALETLGNALWDEGLLHGQPRP